MKPMPVGRIYSIWLQLRQQERDTVRRRSGPDDGNSRGGLHRRDRLGGLLGVQDRVHGLRLSGLEVEERRDDGRGPEVERDRVAPPARVARLDVDQHVVGEHGGDVPVRPAQGLAERAQHRERNAQLHVVHAREHALEIRRLVLQRRLRQLHVALLHCGPQDHVSPDTDERRLRAALQRRHLDRHVLVRRRAAGEAPAVLQLLGRERARVDGVDRQVAGDDLDLALLARAVAAARRVDRDAVPARRVEHRRSGEHARLLDGAILA